MAFFLSTLCAPLTSILVNVLNKVCDCINSTIGNGIVTQTLSMHYRIRKNGKVVMGVFRFQLHMVTVVFGHLDAMWNRGNGNRYCCRIIADLEHF